ncbi:MAG: hypothetical protein LBS42_04540 [Tannerella sp.]|jgi:hypothetical protein|nr:hypothetical protein [Tannerella sp.]
MKVRSYNCKDEELPLIGKYLSESLKRDLKGFTALSPRFDENYALQFDEKVRTCADFVPSESESVTLKVITSRMHETIRSMSAPVSKLSIYLKLAKAAAPLSAADFGVTKLLQKIRIKEVDSLLRQLRTVTDNIHTYHTALTQHGMPATIPKQLLDAAESIDADRRTLFEINGVRQELLKRNMDKMNDLYEAIKEIARMGKKLHRKTNPERANDYVFRELLDRVRGTVTDGAD